MPEDPILIDDIRDDDAEAPLKYAITSYGADYPVDGLVKRLRDGSIIVPEFPHCSNGGLGNVRPRPQPYRRPAFLYSIPEVELATYVMPN